MKFKIIFACLMACPVVVMAQAISPKLFPSDLLYLGQPIDSLCIDQNEGNGVATQLKDCGAIKHNISIQKKDTRLTSKNYVGYEWRDPQYNSQGFSYYQAFPAGPTRYWLYTLNNGGGTGIFTGIFLFKRIDSDSFQMKVIQGGDRCNGGISEVSDHNSRLTYRANLTAYDMLAMAQKNTSIKPYDNLDACAICCIAKAAYEVTENSSPKFQFIDLEKNIDSEQMTVKGSLQNCFNKLVVSYINNGKSKLNEKDLQTFAADFKDRCVK